MSDVAGWVQAGAESGLLALGLVVFFRDGLQARKARRETFEVVEKADTEREVVAEQVAKIESAEDATALAADIRSLPSPFDTLHYPLNEIIRYHAKSTPEQLAAQDRLFGAWRKTLNPTDREA